MDKNRWLFTPHVVRVGGCRPVLLTMAAILFFTCVRSRTHEARYRSNSRVSRTSRDGM